MAAPRYEFVYDADTLMDWIQNKLDATWKKNQTNEKLRPSLRDALSGLSPRETDMMPLFFAVYSRDVEAHVMFHLNPITGEITVQFASETYGNKGGNPWWCLAKPSVDSATCNTIVTADAPYDISIMEYLQTHVVRNVARPHNAGRRKTRKNSKSRKRRNGARNGATQRR